MKLVEAMQGDRMNEGDRFQPNEKCHVLLEMSPSGAIKRVDDGEFIRLSKQTLSIEGEIIPATPKEQSLDLEIGGKSVKIVVNPDLSLEIETDLPVTIRGDVVINSAEEIPAETKVLTAGEWTEKRRESTKGDHWGTQDIECAFNDGHQNGRLEMWLEFKKYLDEKEYQEQASISHPFSLEKAIEKLKPNQ